MKKDIHPDYHTITINLNDGSSFQTRSTWGSEGAVLRPEIDPTNHSVWTGSDQQVLRSGGRIERLNERFKTFGVGLNTKKS